MEEKNITIPDLIKQILESQDLSSDQKVIIISKLVKTIKTEIVVKELFPDTQPVNWMPIYPSFTAAPFYTTCSAQIDTPTIIK